MTQYQIWWLFKVDVFCEAPASVLDLNQMGHRQHVSMHLFSYLSASFVNPVNRDSAFACTHKHTIEDTHFSLGMVPFITALEIAYSCLADKCVDLERYGIVRGRVANKCEGRPLSLPLDLFFFGVAFCQDEKPSCLPDRSVSPSQRLM